jgi:hypothetical protein
MLRKYLDSRLLLGLLFVIGCSLAQAQIISTQINGTVTTEDGQPLEGAEVLIVHVPTGTVSVAVTQQTGRFNARGLRVGGPFSVTVTHEGYQAEVLEDVSTQLGQPVSLNFELASGSAELDALQVVGGTINPVFDPNKIGNGTTIERFELESYASVSRSINDFARFDPRVTSQDKGRQEISIGGANTRFNNLLIDGVATNDNFGLNSNGQPSTGQPISIDWLEQLVVQVSPVDVSQTNSTAGFINAVTKSGTNEYQAQGQFYYRDEGLTGKLNGSRASDFEEKIFGGQISGPIIKDTLFFFVGYEKFDFDGALFSNTPEGLPGNLEGLVNGGGSQVSVDDLLTVINGAQGFGFDPLAPLSSVGLQDERWMGKLDWNIAEGQRASFRYSRSRGNDSNLGSFTDARLSSNFYNEDRKFDSYTLQLFSDWTPNFSSEFRAIYTDYETAFEVPTSSPQVSVETANGGDVRFGTELFRQANALQVDTQSVFWKGSYFTGDHTIDFGVDWTREENDNTFLFGALGNFQFASVEDFLNGNTGVDFELRLPASGNIDDARTIWDFSILGFFAQDTWKVTDNFSFVYGFRIEGISSDDTPTFNQLFADSFGFPNTGTLDSTIVQPRIGFNWQPNWDLQTQFRGSLGVFRGRQPGVWVSNSFTNTGDTIRVFECGNSDDAGNTGCLDLDPNFFINADPQALQNFDIGAVAGGAQDVDATEDGFKPPTELKANFGVDIQLDFLAGSTFSVELDQSWVKDGIAYSHLNLGAPTGQLPDGRDVFFADISTASGDRANADPDFNDVLLLRNTSRGTRTNLSASLRNSWSGAFGSLGAVAAYSRTDADDVNSGTSSRAISNWNNRAVFNPNEDISASANYEIKNRWTFRLDYTKDFFGFGNTIVSMFFEHRSGRPFSWVFDNDANGDDIRDNDLLFVPNPGEAIFVDRDGNADPVGEAAFFQLVADNSVLAAAQGGVVGRNTDRSPTVETLDINFIQQIDIGRFGMLEAFFSVENFLNLIDSDWGLINEVPFEFVAEVVNFEGIDQDTGLPLFNFTPGDDRDNAIRQVDNIPGQSRWAAQLGIRYRF